MKKTEKIKTIIITLIISTILLLCKNNSSASRLIEEVYLVYLNNKVVGTLESKNELYQMIDEKQQAIKDYYGVANVYPPNDFKIVKYYSYKSQVVSPESIYNKIEEMDDFTIKGYEIEVNYANENIAPLEIKVLNKKIFEEAIHEFVLAFVDEKQYNNYINNMQEDIIDTGQIIENMYFAQNITIKETLLSVQDKIYTDSTELSKYLLFGNQAEQKNYMVVVGDTIASVSETNKLNTQEFLIANPKYQSEDSLLVLNDTVNVTLIDPVIDFVYQLYNVEDVEQYYEKKIVYDNTKKSSYSQITQAGIAGITRLTERYLVTNGEQSQGIEKISEEVIREKVDQITTKGKRSYITGSYFDTGSGWGWPTNSGYTITSLFAYRWGKMHDGIDISGTGEGSPIYVVKDGEVVIATKQCSGCSAWSLGNYIVVKHDNGYYTLYGHLSGLNVKVGDIVKKGQIIGKMGSTGYSTGTHLHFGVSLGQPFVSGYQFINPLKLYK